MAKFKDIGSGAVFSFELEHDIKTMRQHPEYVEVVEEVQPVEEKPVKKTVVKAKAE